MQPATDDEALRFGHFEIRRGERVLRLNGRSAAIGARAFDVLLALAERRDRLVTKHELLDLVWPGLVVEEHNLAVQISACASCSARDVIATVPGRGYRFTARCRAPASPTRRPRPRRRRQRPARGRARPSADSCTPLLGRDDDLAALAALVAAHRAGHRGRRRRHRQDACWRSTCVNATPQRIRRTACAGSSWRRVSDAAALPSASPPRSAYAGAPATPLAGLCAAVAPLQMLLALDNAEHLLDDVARVGARAARRRAGRAAARHQPGAAASWRPSACTALGPLAVPQGPLPARRRTDFGAVALFVERRAGGRRTLRASPTPTRRR